MVVLEVVEDDLDDGAFTVVDVPDGPVAPLPGDEEQAGTTMPTSANHPTARTEHLSRLVHMFQHPTFLAVGSTTCSAAARVAVSSVVFEAAHQSARSG